MNLDLARQILRDVEAQPDGCLELRKRHLVREAEFMQEAGWIELTNLDGMPPAVIVRLTDSGRRVDRLFRDDAIAQRLRDAFIPTEQSFKPTVKHSA